MGVLGPSQHLSLLFLPFLLWMTDMFLKNILSTKLILAGQQILAFAGSTFS